MSRQYRGERRPEARRGKHAGKRRLPSADFCGDRERAVRITSRLLALEGEADDEQKVGDARLDRTVADAVLADVTGGEFDDAVHEQKQRRVEQREAEDHEDG